MIPVNELLLFALTAFVMVISPGPNMVYLISRTLAQGEKAGLLSLLGVLCGFIFHSLMVAFGLTALLASVPYAFGALKIAGVVYLLYLAYKAFRPQGANLFAPTQKLNPHPDFQLFTIGFLTNVLNPKIAVFYLSIFPQFIKPAYGSILTQSLQLTLVQMVISFTINSLIILSAGRLAVWFGDHPGWAKRQKWFMGSVLTALALRMAFTRSS